MNEDYLNFCKDNKNNFGPQALPFYAEPYWLNLASSAKNKGWESIVIKQNDEVQLAFAYHYVIKFGFKILLQAQLTPHTFLYLNDEAKENYNLRNQLFSQLTTKLKQNGIDFALFRSEKDFQYLDDLKNHGYGAKKLRTYVTPLFDNEDSLLMALDARKRRDVKKGRREMYLKINDTTPEKYYDFYSQCLKSEGDTINFNKNWFIHLFTEAYNRKKAAFFSIYDKNNTLQSVFVCVHDNTCAYGLTYARFNPGNRSVASAMAMFEAVNYYRKQGLPFDFEGGVAEKRSTFYKRFASIETPVYSIYRHFTLKGFLFKILFINILHRF